MTTTLSARVVAAASSLAILSLCAVAAAQDAPDPAAAALQVTPTLRTFTETATLSMTGLLEVEAAYRLDIAALDGPVAHDLDVHSAELLVGYAVSPVFEGRVGWHLFSFSESDEFGRYGGLGNPYVDGKFRLRLPSSSTPQSLAIRGRVEAGLARELGSEGATLGAAALYTVRVGDFLIDANAGVDFNTAQSPAYVSIPLSGRGTWEPTVWCDVYAELIEVLRVDELRTSATLVRGGVGFMPVDTVSLDITGGVGLSTTVPAGQLMLSAAFLTRPPSR